MGGVGAGFIVEVELVDGLFEGIGESGEAIFEGVEDGAGTGDARFLPGGDIGFDGIEFGIRTREFLFFAKPLAVFVSDEAAHPGAEVA